MAWPPQPPQPDDAEGILASDAERDATAAVLARHLGDGRLSIDEHAERLEETYAARTRGQLARATRDLPSLSTGPQSLPVPRRHTPQARYLVGLATPTVISVGVWAASGMHGSFWPVWVMVGSVGMALRHFSRGGRGLPRTIGPAGVPGPGTGPAVPPPFGGPPPTPLPPMAPPVPPRPPGDPGRF